MGRRSIPIEDRLWARVVEDEATGCWNWTGCRRPDGYGHIGRRDGRLVYPHRLAYELVVGKIPEGLQIDHLCRNTSCCNPRHLEPVTMRENILRGNSPAAKNARKTHCIHGHPFDEENTYRPPAGGRLCRACMRAADRRSKDKLILRRRAARLA